MEYYKKSVGTILLTMLTAWLVVYFLLGSIVFGAVPSLLSGFVSEKGSVVYEISHKPRDYYKWKYKSANCRGTIYLKSEMPMFTSKLCHIPEPLWNKSKPDDKIEIIGKVSYFGVLPSRYIVSTSRT